MSNIHRFPPREPGTLGLKGVGYWASEYQPDLPRPQNRVDLSWDPAERAIVIAYLKRGQTKQSFRGYDACRMPGCTKRNKGSKDLGDDVYCWPQGFAHYVEDHNVRPPATFVEHVLSRACTRELRS